MHKRVSSTLTIGNPVCLTVDLMKQMFKKKKKQKLKSWLKG